MGLTMQFIMEYTILLYIQSLTLLFIMLQSTMLSIMPLLMDMRRSTTVQLLMLLSLLKCAPLLLRLSVRTLRSLQRSSLIWSNATQSPVLSVLRVCLLLTMRSAPTLTNRRLRPQQPRLLRFLTRRCVTPRWSLSASQPQDTDTTAMDTTTARRLPRRLATMSLLSPLLSQLLRLPTLSQSRPVSTSQSLSQESAVRTSLRRSASLPQRLKTPLLPLRSASPSLLLLLARLLSLLSPSRFARKSTMDMLRTPMRLSQSHMLLPLLLMPLKMVIRPDIVIIY